ncbi:FimV/HubP family polar landmark protein [Teredinibacter haidensis]|uniref:FimV/HubP family polar landmark protein n=1 Tax=Teredinibacter haidensis TaxID=2731755 RepID=UPI000948CF5F|nr:FimV/HubP family polar landmark protein [Teredinibacter haidensis]
MGHRILVLLLGAFAMVLPQAVFALGLGEITLKSALNQPLNAEIELLQVRDLSESEILVGLASAQDFERVGVERPYFLTSLKFKVRLTGGSPAILVSSTKPVKEPFVNFVLQAQWPSGRLLREYTLLMDLPVFSGEKAAPVAATSRNTQPKPRAQPATNQVDSSAKYNPRSSFDEAPSQPSSSITGYQQSEPNYSGDDYGPVKANDTLWDIAKSVRPDRGVSIQQTMLALQRLNPEAFINNNINLLRKGQILRVPDRNQIVEYTKQRAISEVAVQNTSWSGDPNAGYGAQLEGSKSVASYEEAPEVVEGRVSLSSPEDVSSSLEGRGTGSGAGSTEALENELAITLEQLDKTERENSDLKSHVESLEEQIQTMERMIEISSEDMRALELSVEKTKQAQAQADAAADEQAIAEGGEDILDEASMADADVLVADSAVEDATAMPSDSATVDVADSVATEEVLDATAELEVTPTPMPRPKVVSAPRPVEKSILDHILDNLIFIVGGLVALILGAFFIIRQRRESEEFIGESDDFLSQADFDTTEPEEPLFEETAAVIGADLEDDGYEEEAPEEVVAEPEIEEPSAAEAQTEDVVAEADIYIAYGKYDQAEEMLSSALEREPSDTAIRIKLLEVYAQQQDIERFDPHYAALLASRDAHAKGRAEELRSSIQDAPEFDNNLYDAAVETASNMDSDTLGAPLSDLASHLGDEVEDDFEELSLDLNEASEQASGEFSENVSDLDESLDFELDIESLDTEDESTSDNGSDFDLELGDIEPLEDLADDESLDFELPELDESGVVDTGLELELDLEEVSSDDGDLDIEDFDLDFDAKPSIEGGNDDELGVLELGALDDELASLSLEDTEDTSVDLDTDLSALDLDIGEEPEDLSLELDADVEKGDYDLGDLDIAGELDLELGDDALDIATGSDDLLDELALDEDEEFVSELMSESVELRDESESDMGEDLDLSDDLDLSALDQELDALTSDLGVEEADIDSLELTAPIEPSLENDFDFDDDSDLPATPTVMEEPITDFDDFEVELEQDLTEDLEPETLSDDASETVDVESLVGSDDAEDNAEETGEDTLFEQALADVPDSDLEFNIPEIDPEADEDDDLGFLSDSDETATKLDLARAYIDMGDADGARDILDEIMKEGNPQQKQEAENLLSRV